MSEGVTPSAGSESGLGSVPGTTLSLALGIDLGLFQDSAWLSPANAGTSQQC